jgi:predicted DCC family thiol-disulfide oxidoreductase YuxK
MAAGASASPDPFASLPPRIVFFDGVCAFCDQTVRWLVDRDPQERLHFAPLQGETAEVVRALFPGRFPDDIDTLVYLHPSSSGAPEIALRSGAIFALCAEIGFGNPWLPALSRLPSWLADLGYRLFAASRYRLFGKLDTCDIPTPEEIQANYDKITDMSEAQPFHSANDVMRHIFRSVKPR